MATSLELKRELPTFDPSGDPTSTAPRWKRWKRAFELFAVGKGIKDPTQKRALMLHMAGMEVQDIFDTLADTGEPKDYDKAIAALDAYFSPAVNIPFERHMFRQMTQKEDETVGQFLTRLNKRLCLVIMEIRVTNLSEIKSLILVIRQSYVEKYLKRDKPLH